MTDSIADSPKHKKPSGIPPIHIAHTHIYTPHCTNDRHNAPMTDTIADSPKQKKPSGMPQARFQWKTTTKFEMPSAVQMIVPLSNVVFIIKKKNERMRNSIHKTAEWKYEKFRARWFLWKRATSSKSTWMYTIMYIDRHTHIHVPVYVHTHTYKYKYMHMRCMNHIDTRTNCTRSSPSLSLCLPLSRSFRLSLYLCLFLSFSLYRFDNLALTLSFSLCLSLSFPPSLPDFLLRCLSLFLFARARALSLSLPLHTHSP